MCKHKKCYKKFIKCQIILEKSVINGIMVLWVLFLQGQCLRERKIPIFGWFCCCLAAETAGNERNVYDERNAEKAVLPCSGGCDAAGHDADACEGL